MKNPLYVLAPFSDTPYNGSPAYEPVPAWNSLGANRKLILPGAWRFMLR